MQLQEEVSLPVPPADLHAVLHSILPIHFSEHLSVWLQVCHFIIPHSFACLENADVELAHNMSSYYGFATTMVFVKSLFIYLYVL